MKFSYYGEDVFTTSSKTIKKNTVFIPVILYSGFCENHRNNTRRVFHDVLTLTSTAAIVQLTIHRCSVFNYPEFWVGEVRTRRRIKYNCFRVLAF